VVLVCISVAVSFFTSLILLTFLSKLIVNKSCLKNVTESDTKCQTSHTFREELRLLS
jgi:hypothetical protein